MREWSNPLDKLEIASPCSADWNQMFGSARKKFCSECSLNVYDISEMTQKEAEDLILRSEGRLCLRLYKRADGTVITKNCPVGWARVKRRMTRVSGAVAGLLGGFLMGVLGLGALRGIEDLTSQKQETPLAEIPIPSGDEVTFGLYGDIGSQSLANVGLEILTSRFLIGDSKEK